MLRLYFANYSYFLFEWYFALNHIIYHCVVYVCFTLLILFRCCFIITFVIINTIQFNYLTHVSYTFLLLLTFLFNHTFVALFKTKLTVISVCPSRDFPQLTETKTHLQIRTSSWASCRTPSLTPVLLLLLQAAPPPLT